MNLIIFDIPWDLLSNSNIFGKFRLIARNIV